MLREKIILTKRATHSWLHMFGGKFYNIIRKQSHTVKLKTSSDSYMILRYFKYIIITIFKLWVECFCVLIFSYFYLATCISYYSRTKIHKTEPLQKEHKQTTHVKKKDKKQAFPVSGLETWLFSETCFMVLILSDLKVNIINRKEIVKGYSEQFRS